MRSLTVSGNNAEQTTLKEKILTDKKNKKINQAKMILALILSNFFIYILVSPSNKVVESKLENKVPSGYSRIVIKAESLVTSEQNAKTISILNKEKQVVIAHAILIKPIESSIEQKRFEIEIKNEEALTLAKYDEFILIPKIEITTNKLQKKFKGDQHEIIF